MLSPEAERSRCSGRCTGGTTTEPSHEHQNQCEWRGQRVHANRSAAAPRPRAPGVAQEFALQYHVRRRQRLRSHGASRAAEWRATAFCTRPRPRVPARQQYIPKRALLPATLRARQREAAMQRAAARAAGGSVTQKRLVMRHPTQENAAGEGEGCSRYACQADSRRLLRFCCRGDASCSPSSAADRRPLQACQPCQQPCHGTRVARQARRPQRHAVCADSRSPRHFAIPDVAIASSARSVPRDEVPPLHAAYEPPNAARCRAPFTQ